MSESLSSDQIALFCRALQGELSLIGWGHRENFHFQRWQEQFPLVALTDTRHLLWDQTLDGYPVINPLALRDYDAKKHALIRYFLTPWVDEYTARVSGMPTLPPLPLQHIFRSIETGAPTGKGPLTPFSSRQIKDLYAKLAPTLKQRDPLQNDFALTKPERYTENLALLGSYDWADLVAGLCATTTAAPAKPNCVVLAGNSWCTGGAERQMLNLALGFSRKGWETHSLSLIKDDTTPHYLELLHAHNIPVQAIDTMPGREQDVMKALLKQSSPALRLGLWHMPLAMTLRIARAIHFFRTVRPSLVIAYLDWASVIAGLAATLAGVPRIIISGRNYAPDRFPHFFEGHIQTFRRMYQILDTCPNVTLTNNSRLGGESYADWLGINRERVATVPNCLTDSFMTSAKPTKIEALRRSLGLKATDQVILGVFRLAPEKRPDKFLDVFQKLATGNPRLKAVICGTGFMEKKLRERLVRDKLDDRVILAGITGEVREMMGMADILLHTAAFEGMPNVILEAQSQGLPVVCTRSGGVMDCLAPSLHPYSFAKNDWAGVTEAARFLLKTPRKRRELGQDAQRYVRRHFSLPRLIDRNLDLAGLAKDPRTSSPKRKKT